MKYKYLFFVYLLHVLMYRFWLCNIEYINVKPTSILSIIKSFYTLYFYYLRFLFQKKFLVLTVKQYIF